MLHTSPLFQASSRADLSSRPAGDRRSTGDLVTRTSALSLSLFPERTPDPTSTTAAQGLLVAATAPPTSDHHTRTLSRRHFGRLGSPRSFARSEVPEFSRNTVYDQPQSRAGPLPSGSILDFAKYVDQLTEHKATQAQRKNASRPPSTGSPRNASADRAFENKEWTVEVAVQGNGGLTNAMQSAATDQNLHIEWIGTLGFPTDALTATKKRNIDDHLLNEYASTVVYASDKDLNGHYTHFCKTILWPIFHYQVPDHPKSKAYADHSWDFYVNVNQAFADKIVAGYKRGDTIWINDYHLLLVPGMVRQKLGDASIGFFLHTAFPSSEVFRVLAKRKELLDGMLGANLVAFQTEEYAQHFLQTCSRLLTVETTREGVQLEHHFVNVVSHPIGINPVAVNEARQEADVQQWIEDIKERYKDKLLIVARDKLDNVHGVRQKLLAYEIFLKKYPDLADKTVLIQVATSTNEKTELVTTVYDICERIDNKYSSLVHQPLVFLKQDIEFSQYLALISVADLLMISSLRDGMNLTGHEFVFCQDGQYGSNKHGPLILSEFTGSATVFHDQLSINPWDYRKMADAINTALLMSAEEKERRWKGLHSVVLSQTGGHWAEQLGKDLAKVHEEHHERALTSVPRLSTAVLTEKYKDTKNRVFIIDYEGTIAPHKTNDGIPLSSPNRVVDTLNDLMSDSKNTVYIMSGRQVVELESVFRTATGLGLIAENGCFVRSYGAPARKWDVAVDLAEVEAWMSSVRGILNYYQERMEGSYIEERQTSLILRYERVGDGTKASEDSNTRFVGDCADQINGGYKTMRIHAVPIFKAVLVEQVEFSKGTAAMDVYNDLVEKSKKANASPPDFLMVAGDDREDEVVFRWANSLEKSKEVQDVFTVSLGKRNTEAQATVTQGHTGLHSVLQKLARVSLPLDSEATDSPLTRVNTAAWSGARD